jgi:heat-inducible transcriptional repressor
VYDGVQNIIAQPEFAATSRIRDMLGLLEDRARIVQILPPALRADEVHVSIGSEHHVELLRDCSLIVARYGAAGDVVGYVGVVGPTRMDYARTIGAVRYVGSLMSNVVRVMEGH